MEDQENELSSRLAVLLAALGYDSRCTLEFSSLRDEELPRFRAGESDGISEQDRKDDGFIERVTLLAARTSDGSPSMCVTGRTASHAMSRAISAAEGRISDAVKVTGEHVELIQARAKALQYVLDNQLKSSDDVQSVLSLLR